MVTQIFPQGSALAHLPFFGRGSTQCKGPLSRQMASRSAKPTSNLRGAKVVPAVVMPPQAHRELPGKQSKTKQSKTQGSVGSTLSKATLLQPPESVNKQTNKQTGSGSRRSFALLREEPALP